ncbi:hypothetical protein N7456_007105 [Penicillium angulare]|uniref:Uncharacterized protein n=1 Tax=Penicillium angulare TaxID=116970 RepID=A0A9W9KCN1_9EURO|nr:hypothetical protein N7456_007105 [Penicillium angulare]
MASGRAKWVEGQIVHCEPKYCLPFTASPHVYSLTSQRQHAPVNIHPSRITPIKNHSHQESHQLEVALSVSFEGWAIYDGSDPLNGHRDEKHA